MLHSGSGVFQANQVDAVTVDGGLTLKAGQAPYLLKPVVMEFYLSKDGGGFSLGPQVSGVVLL